MKNEFIEKFYNTIISGFDSDEIQKQKFEEIFCASDEKSSVETMLTEETAEMPIVNQASNIEEGSSTIPEMGVGSSDSKCTAPNESCRGCEIVSSHTNKEV